MRLGHGTPFAAEAVPRVVSGLAEEEIAAMACGGAHTAVVTGEKDAKIVTCLPKSLIMNRRHASVIKGGVPCAECLRPASCKSRQCFTPFDPGTVNLFSEYLKI